MTGETQTSGTSRYHLQPNQVVDGTEGQKFRILRYLGEGVTSEVYSARPLGPDGSEEGSTDVALKMLRPDVTGIIRDNFWREGSILGTLVRAEQDAQDQIASIPRLLSRQQQGDVQFIAMDLVQGDRLDHLLEGGAYLEEMDALLIADRVLRVMELLHQQARRTYTDFQLQNIVVQRDAEGMISNVKIMDWNTVSEAVPADQALPADFGQADLARFGAYLYRMLTGKGADERGEPAARLKKRAGARWEAISLGTRQILLRALHPNPQHRFESASTFREAIQDQMALWKQDWRPEGNKWIIVVGEVGALLTALEVEAQSGQRGPDFVARLMRVQALLDMASRQNLPEERVSPFKRQLDPLVGDTSPTWKIGEDYYGIAQYQEAAKWWREEARAMGEARLFRHLMLAEAGATLNRAEFNQARALLEQAVAALLGEHPQEAREALDTLPPSVTNSPPVAALVQEAEVQLAMGEAHELDKPSEINEAAWQRAATAYVQADKALGRIPYAQQLRDEKGWVGLTGRAEVLERRIKARAERAQTEVQLTRLLRDPSQFEEGIRVVRMYLDQEPADPGVARLILEEGERLLLEEGERLLKTDDLERAVELLGVGALFAGAVEYEEPLRKAWKKALAQKREAEARAQSSGLYNEIERALSDKKWYEVRRLTSLVEPAHLEPSSVWQLVRDTLGRELDAALNQRNLVLADLLIGALAALTLDTVTLTPYQKRYATLRTELEHEHGPEAYVGWAKEKAKKLDASEYQGFIKNLDEQLALLPTDASSVIDELRKLRAELQDKDEKARQTRLVETGLARLAELNSDSVEQAKKQFQLVIGAPESEATNPIRDKAQRGVQLAEQLAVQVVSQLDQADDLLRELETSSNVSNNRATGAVLRQASIGGKQQALSHRSITKGGIIESEAPRARYVRAWGAVERAADIAPKVWQQQIGTPPHFPRIEALRKLVAAKEIAPLKPDPVPPPIIVPEPRGPLSLPRWLLPLLAGALLFSILSALLAGVPYLRPSAAPEDSAAPDGTAALEEALSERFDTIDETLDTVGTAMAALADRLVTIETEVAGLAAREETPTEEVTPSATPQPALPLEPIALNPPESPLFVDSVPKLTVSLPEEWQLLPSGNSFELLSPSSVYFVPQMVETSGTEDVDLEGSFIEAGTSTLQWSATADQELLAPASPARPVEIVLRGIPSGGDGAEGVTLSSPFAFRILEAPTITIASGINGFTTWEEGASEPPSDTLIPAGTYTVLGQRLGERKGTGDAATYILYLRVRSLIDDTRFWVRWDDVDGLTADQINELPFVQD